LEGILACPRLRHPRLRLRDAGLDLAVRGGGHSVARHSIVDGGIVIDLRDLKALDIDADGRAASAGTGLTAGEYTVAAGAYGLATGFGDTGSVGIGGITLAGGIGYLVRKHGLTVDDLLSAEVVTADGDVLQVDEDSHPDLFWAIRGGGGNFGVATRYKLRLHEVDKIVGGMLFLPVTPDAIVSLVEETTSAPDEVSAMVNVMKAPPMPFIPEEHHGRPLVMVLLAYAGDLDAGDMFVDRLRKLGPPVADMIRRMPYTEVFPREEKGSIQSQRAEPCSLKASIAQRRRPSSMSSRARARLWQWPICAPLVERWRASPSTPPRSLTAAARNS
jgi:FAD binding domain